MTPKFTSGDDDALNAFITLETLSIGVEGKRCMWKALKTVEDPTRRSRTSTSTSCIARAESQRERIEAKRLEIAPQRRWRTPSRA